MFFEEMEVNRRVKVENNLSVTLFSGIFLKGKVNELELLMEKERNLLIGNREWPKPMLNVGFVSSLTGNAKLMIKIFYWKQRALHLCINCRWCIMLTGLSTYLVNFSIFFLLCLFTE